MKSRAAIAWESGRELEVDLVDLEGPKAGEVLIRNIATGVCHTDAFTLSGDDPEGIFPSILGHEGGAVVEEIGAGVNSVNVGDHVIPLYVPECGECRFCKSGKTNLCQSIRLTQGKGIMPDGTSRFSHKGKTLFHYMGTSTFSEYSVLPEISIAKIIYSVDEKIDLTRCHGTQNCQKDQRCLTHDLWMELNMHVSSFLNGITVDDLINRNNVRHVSQQQDFAYVQLHRN